MRNKIKMTEIIQKKFKEALLDRNYQDFSFIKSSHSAERFNIYRNTVIENIRNCLENTYPGVWKLLGKECADNVARAYSLKNLPKDAVLDKYGSEFPNFLSSFEEFKDLPYLSDYAEYEWLKSQVYMAEEVIFRAISLEDIKKNSLDRVQIELIPALKLYKSVFPIDKIEEIANNENSQPITLKSKKIFAVIARPGKLVESHWIAEDLWYFIDQINNNLSVEDLVEKTFEQYPKFNLTYGFEFLIKNKLIAQTIFCSVLS